MKKIIVLFAVFCLFATGFVYPTRTYANPASDGTTEAKDAMSAKVEISLWPEFPANAVPVFYSADECLLLPAPGEYFAPVLYNVRNGRVTELKAHKADTEIWTEMALDTLMGVGIDYSDEEIDYLLDAYGPMGLFFAGMAGQNRYVSHALHNGVMLIETRYTGLMIFLESAVMRPVDAYAMLDDGSYIIIGDSLTGAYTIRHADASTTEVSYSFDPGYEAAVSGLAFGHDAVAIIGAEQIDDRNAPREFSVGFMNGYDSGEVSAYVPIGNYSPKNGPTDAFMCGPTAAFAYNKAVLPVYPPVLVNAEAGSALALVWDGESLSGVPVGELAGDDGALSVKHLTDCYLYPLGASNDGKYAAFVESGQGDLLIVNVNTLDVKRAIKGEYVEASGLQPLLNTLVGWDGDAVISGKLGYDLIFRYE